jgi:hypothetical protein
VPEQRLAEVLARFSERLLDVLYFEDNTTAGAILTMACHRVTNTLRCQWPLFPLRKP